MCEKKQNGPLKNKLGKADIEARGGNRGAIIGRKKGTAGTRKKENRVEAKKARTKEKRKSSPRSRKTSTSQNT